MEKVDYTLLGKMLAHKHSWRYQDVEEKDQVDNVEEKLQAVFWVCILGFVVGAAIGGVLCQLI